MSPSQTSPSKPSPAYHHGDLRRALVEAAVLLVAEEQAWDFSLRAVARRANVSHNAPYNHFADKRDLLAAVAAAGYDALRLRLVEALGPVPAPPQEALEAIGVAYVGFGVANPAHYRLMFGPALVLPDQGLPVAVLEAAQGAKAVLAEVVHQGARDGSFGILPDNREALDAAVLATWATVHGLTMLLIDGLAVPGVSTLSIEAITRSVTKVLMDGVRTGEGSVHKS